MHDSFSIVVAITAILIPNLHLQVYAYPSAYTKSSVVASRSLISSDHVDDHVLWAEIWRLFLHFHL